MNRRCKNLPGFIKVVSKGNYVAVVCEREEQAIRAARQLKTTWEKPATAPFPASEDLFNYMRAATPTSASNPIVAGDPDAAFSGAAKIIEAEYEVPFQGHTAFAGAHATADPSNGQMTVYSNDMKSYGMRNGVATFLGMPRDKVRVVWMQGPQGFGRTAADDAGCEAAWIAREIGRPVRMQWMRDEETAWDTKGPAFLVKVRGGLDAAGTSRRVRLPRAFLRLQPRRLQRARYRADRATHGIEAGQTGRRQFRHCLRICTRFPIAGWLGDVVGLPMVWETPLRTGNLRDPNGPQSTFAAESFIDEAGGGGESRSAGIPHEDAQGRHQRRQRIPARAVALRFSRPPRKLMAGIRVLRRNRSAKETS